MNGRPYFLPSQVDTSMCALGDVVGEGQRAILSVMSGNSPADVQLGMNTTSAENRSGSPLGGRRRADLGLVVVGRDDGQLDLVLVRSRCRLAPARPPAPASRRGSTA